jgi:DNA-binding CsgD family transcriptional regulator
VSTGDGVFGRGEKWIIPDTGSNRMIFLYIFIIAIALIVFVLVLILIKTGKKADNSSLDSAASIESTIKDIIESGINLTPREKDVLSMLMSGLPDKQIAINLNFTISSVNFHSKNIYRKLGIQSRTELLVKYIK